MEQKLRAFHRGVVLVIGYACIVFMLILGAVEFANKLKLAEGLRGTWITVDYSGLEEQLKRR